MPVKINGQVLVPFDATVFRAGDGSLSAKGYCAHGRHCGYEKAEFMVQQAGRTGHVWIGLCRDHAATKAGGAANLPLG